MMEEEEGAEEQQRFSYRQRLKAAVHYTVGCLCEEVASDKDMPFSKQTIAAISEVTFRQCENFAKDLEMFARHAKRSTINTEDVKLLARRSNSLVRDESLCSPPSPIRTHYSQLITRSPEVILQGTLH
uniref:Centromere protein S n=1 Tax=Sus scrofa TaxID=9823 RepID=A0A4X1W8K9_PIG